MISLTFSCEASWQLQRKHKTRQQSSSPMTSVRERLRLRVTFRSRKKSRRSPLPASCWTDVCFCFLGGQPCAVHLWLSGLGKAAKLPESLHGHVPSSSILDIQTLNRMLPFEVLPFQVHAHYWVTRVPHQRRRSISQTPARRASTRPAASRCLRPSGSPTPRRLLHCRLPESEAGSLRAVWGLRFRVSCLVFG